MKNGMPLWREAHFQVNMQILLAWMSKKSRTDETDRSIVSYSARRLGNENYSVSQSVRQFQLSQVGIETVNHFVS